ncbi:unnamed protein product [Closterium sp. Naga37s-1]|nr:unnamed protein product [Closterium sp. Naga37s-1]
MDAKRPLTRLTPQTPPPVCPVPCALAVRDDALYSALHSLSTLHRSLPLSTPLSTTLHLPPCAVSLCFRHLIYFLPFLRPFLLTRFFSPLFPTSSTMVTKIVNTNNVLVIGVNFKMPVSTVGQVDCNYLETRYIDFIGKYACPAVWLYRVWGVQVVQGNVYGRVEVARANHSRIDSMDVLVKATNQPGAIVVMLSGDGPNLIRSNVVISNNNIRTEGTIGQGAAVGIMLYRGAVGVDVIGNRISHFSLASLQLGWGQSNVGDAMLSLVTKNDIVHGFGQLGDSAGIYLDTHWVNPGNVLRCNYVQRGGHCLYLDWVSSGTVVDGLVCEQTADGMKLNTGKNNEVRGMVIIDSKEPLAGYISCQNYGVNNCDKPNGIKWNNDLLTYYQTPGIKKLQPSIAFLLSPCPFAPFSPPPPCPSSLPHPSPPALPIPHQLLQKDLHQ